jgi:hypothetical protein
MKRDQDEMSVSVSVREEEEAEAEEEGPAGGDDVGLVEQDGMEMEVDYYKSIVICY